MLISCVVDLCLSFRACNKQLFLIKRLINRMLASLVRTTANSLAFMPHENTYTCMTYLCQKFGAFIMAKFDAMVI